MIDSYDIAIIVARAVACVLGLWLLWLALLPKMDRERGEKHLRAFSVRVGDREARITGTVYERLQKVAEICGAIASRTVGSRMWSAQRFVTVTALLLLGLVLADAGLAGGKIWALITEQARRTMPASIVVLSAIILLALPAFFDAGRWRFEASLAVAFLAIGLVLGLWTVPWVIALAGAVLLDSLVVQLILGGLRSKSLPMMAGVHLAGVLAVPVLGLVGVAISAAVRVLLSDVSFPTATAQAYPHALAMALASGPIVLVAFSGALLFAMSFVHWLLWKMTSGLVMVLDEREILQKKKLLLSAALSLLALGMPGSTAAGAWVLAILG